MGHLSFYRPGLVATQYFNIPATFKIFGFSIISFIANIKIPTSVIVLRLPPTQTLPFFSLSHTLLSFFAR
jgi:hypothetical protein